MRRVTIFAGVVFVAIGIREAVNGATWSSVRAMITWFVGGTLIHDGAIVPLTMLAGLVLARFVPGTYRSLAQGALVTSAMVSLPLLPLLSGMGRTATNPSQQPLQYGRNLLLVLAIVWVGAALLAVRRRQRERRADRAT